jgi:hypothetical protein
MASECSESDLFSICSGTGNNVAVLLEVTFKIHNISER